MRLIIRLRRKHRPTAAGTAMGDSVAELVPVSAGGVGVGVGMMDAPVAEFTPVALAAAPVRQESAAPAVVESAPASHTEAPAQPSEAPAQPSEAPAQPSEAPALPREASEQRREEPSVLRCALCGSRDVWRFGRVNWLRRLVADVRRGQWITCRKCGKRFISTHYGPMSRDDDE